MMSILVSLLFIIGSIGVMIGAVVINRFDPGYSSALAIPIYNAISIVFALIGVVAAFMACRSHTHLVLAARIRVLAIACLTVLIILFPLSNAGSLSVVR